MHMRQVKVVIPDLIKAFEDAHADRVEALPKFIDIRSVDGHLMAQPSQKVRKREGEKLRSGKVQEVMVGEEDSQLLIRLAALVALRGCLDLWGEWYSFFLFIFPADEVISEIRACMYGLSLACIPLCSPDRKIGAVIFARFLPLLDRDGFAIMLHKSALQDRTFRAQLDFPLAKGAESQGRQIPIRHDYGPIFGSHPPASAIILMCVIGSDVEIEQLHPYRDYVLRKIEKIRPVEFDPFVRVEINEPVLWTRFFLRRCQYGSPILVICAAAIGIPVRAVDDLANQRMGSAQNCSVIRRNVIVDIDSAAAEPCHVIQGIFDDGRLVPDPNHPDHANVRLVSDAKRPIILAPDFDRAQACRLEPVP